MKDYRKKLIAMTEGFEKQNVDKLVQLSPDDVKEVAQALTIIIKNRIGNVDVGLDSALKIVNLIGNSRVGFKVWDRKKKKYSEDNFCLHESGDLLIKLCGDGTWNKGDSVYDLNNSECPYAVEFIKIGNNEEKVVE